MTMIRSYSSGLLASLVVAAVFFCQGCGTGEYSRRMQAYIGGQGNDEVKLFDAFTLKEIQGKEIRVRIPLAFKDRPFTPDSDVDEARKKIPFANLAGHERTYEGFVEETNGTKTPYYCYLAARDVSRESSVENRILKPLGSALRNLSSDVKLGEQYIFKRPDGTPSEWRLWRVAGPMDFVQLTPDGQENKVRAEGVLEVYALNRDSILVFVAWRYPNSLASYSGKGFPGIEPMREAVGGRIRIVGKE